MARRLRLRAVPYGLALLAVYVLVLGAAAWRGAWLLQDGRLVPGDFISFWTAGQVALSGRAAEAYDWELLKQAQLALGARDFEGFFAWHNPPSFFLFVIPFAALPYAAAWLAWIAVTGALLAAALRLILPGWLVPAALAAPATLLCAMVGQNGLLVAALMAAWLALLDRRPAASGALLGLLTVKPQFGVLFPLFLIAGGHWRALAAATAATLLLGAVSAVVFGTEAWVAFLGSITTTGGALAAGGAGWVKLQSAYALGFRLTGDLLLAMLLHAALAAAVVVALVRQGRAGARADRRAAALVAAAFVVSPYAYAYDAVMLTVAAAFLFRDGLKRGFAPGEAGAIGLALALPAAYPLTGLPAALAAALLLLALALAPRDAARRGGR